MSPFPSVFPAFSGAFRRDLRRILQKWGRPRLSGMLMLAPTLAQAQEQVGARVFQAGDYLGQVVFSLLLVIGLILLAAWLLRRFAQLPGAQGQAVRVLSAVAVGRQEKILLLDVGGEQILVGVTPSRISTLHVLAEPLALPDNAEKDSRGFPRWLQHAVEQYGRERAAEDDNRKG